MSFYGSLEDAKNNAHKATKQIDGLEPGATSPVHEGGSGTADGSAPIHLQMDKTEFTTDRHHIDPVTRGGNLNISNRREWPAGGTKKASTA